MTGTKSVNWTDANKARVLDALLYYTRVKVSDETAENLATHVGGTCSAKAVKLLLKDGGRRIVPKNGAPTIAKGTAPAIPASDRPTNPSSVPAGPSVPAGSSAYAAGSVPAVPSVPAGGSVLAGSAAPASRSAYASSSVLAGSSVPAGGFGPNPFDNSVRAGTGFDLGPLGSTLTAGSFVPPSTFGKKRSAFVKEESPTEEAIRRSMASIKKHAKKRKVAGEESAEAEERGSSEKKIKVEEEDPTDEEAESLEEMRRDRAA